MFIIQRLPGGRGPGWREAVAVLAFFFFFVALACLDGSRDRAKHPQRSGQQCPLWLTQDLLGDNVHDNYGDENCER